MVKSKEAKASADNRRHVGGSIERKVSRRSYSLLVGIATNTLSAQLNKAAVDCPHSEAGHPFLHSLFTAESQEREENKKAK